MFSEGLPGCAAVVGDVNLAIVRSGIKETGNRPLGEGGDRVARVIVGSWLAACQVGAEDLPGVPLVVGAEDIVAGVVERMALGPGEKDGAGTS